MKLSPSLTAVAVLLLLGPAAGQGRGGGGGGRGGGEAPAGVCSAANMAEFVAPINTVRPHVLSPTPPPLALFVSARGDRLCAPRKVCAPGLARLAARTRPTARMGFPRPARQAASAP